MYGMPPPGYGGPPPGYAPAPSPYGQPPGYGYGVPPGAAPPAYGGYAAPPQQAAYQQPQPGLLPSCYCTGCYASTEPADSGTIMKVRQCSVPLVPCCISKFVTGSVLIMTWGSAFCVQPGHPWSLQEIEHCANGCGLYVQACTEALQAWPLAQILSLQEVLAQPSHRCPQTHHCQRLTCRASMKSFWSP